LRTKSKVGGGGGNLKGKTIFPFLDKLAINVVLISNKVDIKVAKQSRLS